MKRQASAGLEGKEALHDPRGREPPSRTGPRQPSVRGVASDQLWVADFTYCSTWSGVVYVAFIIDVFSRRLVGWKASRSMTADLVVDALNMAAWTRATKLDGLICHTDAGAQYTSVSYTDRIDELGVSASIGTVGDSYDNALAESVMGIFKTELHRNPQSSVTMAGTGEDSTTSRSPRAPGLVVQRRATTWRAERPHARGVRVGVS